jgi:hypothetical protein
MKQFDDGALIALCIMSGFTLILATIFGGLSTEAQKQSLYQKTYDKSMECRIAFKGRSSNEMNEFCGEIPKLEDFLTK